MVGPEGHDEAIAFMDMRIDSGIECCDWSGRACELPSQFDLERGYLPPAQRYSYEDIRRQQTHRQLVRIVNHDCVIDPQVLIPGELCCRRYRTRSEFGFHDGQRPVMPASLAARR